MSFSKQIAVLITQIFLVAVCFAQGRQIDSLKKLLSTESKEDTTQADRLFYLSSVYIYDKPDSAIYYAEIVLKLSKGLGYTIREAWSNFNLGEAHFILGNYPAAMQYNLQALNLFQQMKRPAGVSSIKYSIGDLYKEMGDYKQALQYYFEARKMDEENPGDLQLTLPNIPLKPRLIINDLSVAEAYLVGNRLDSALFFARRGFIKDRELKDDWIYPALVLGNIYFKRNQLDSALYYYGSACKEAPQNDRIDVNNGMAAVFRVRNRPDSCRYYATMALNMAQRIHYRKAALRAGELLAWSYEKVNPSKAIQYYKMSTTINDSLYDREKLSRINFLVFAQKQKEQELQATKEKYQNRLKIYALSVIVAFFLLIAVFLWRSNRHRHTAYALLQKQTENELQIQKLESERITAALQQQATQLQMQALRAQMNPHFIFNSLNSINRFIMQNNRMQASQYLTKFSKLVRMVLQNSQASLITLESELESLKLYLEMESLRFNYHFNYRISVPNDLDVEMLKVPPLIIQPYVENAIWHGLMHREERGQLDIEVGQEKECLFFKIADNGIGRQRSSELKSKSATRHKSMGSEITAQRINALPDKNGDESRVVINDLVEPDGTGAGTEVIIKLRVIYD